MFADIRIKTLDKDQKIKILKYFIHMYTYIHRQTHLHLQIPAPEQIDFCFAQQDMEFDKVTLLWIFCLYFMKSIMLHLILSTKA